ncbi:MAG: sulfatase [Gammaproteobacteria bacterium]|nr:sulfatase [Gammaproteobacteria bacterium]
MAGRPQAIWCVLTLLGMLGTPGERAFAETASPAADAPTRPVNILFIVADDLNVALGTYGVHETAVTPHLDRLASEGVRFDRAFANDPVCNPSRTSFLSGRRPATTGVYDNFTRPRETLGDVTMLPEYFAEHGFFTARVGKIAHRRYEDAVSWDVSENAIGRAHYLPGEDAAEIQDNTWHEGAEAGMSRADLFARHGRTGGAPLAWRATSEDDGGTPDGRTARRVIELLRAHGHGPFFIAAGFHKPHLPWVAPSKDFKRHPIAEVVPPHAPPDDRDDIPAPALSGFPDDALHTDTQVRQAIAAYHATVTMVDRYVGQVLHALRQLGLEESTVVVFTSDHGFHLGEHGGLWRKHTQFEESTRVPLIVRGPGVPAGATTKALVELVDLYPTLADLARLPSPVGLEGTSFRPVLEDPVRPWKSAAFSEARRTAHGSSIRTARYRYTEWTPLSGDGPVERELYDLEADPHEFDNLAADPEHRVLRDDLARRLAAGWRAALPST